MVSPTIWEAHQTAVSFTNQCWDHNGRKRQFLFYDDSTPMKNKRSKYGQLSPNFLNHMHGYMCIAGYCPMRSDDRSDYFWSKFLGNAWSNHCYATISLVTLNFSLTLLKNAIWCPLLFLWKIPRWYFENKDCLPGLKLWIANSLVLMVAFIIIIFTCVCFL